MKLIHCNADADCKFSASDTDRGIRAMAAHFKEKHPEYPSIKPRPMKAGPKAWRNAQ